MAVILVPRWFSVILPMSLHLRQDWMGICVLKLFTFLLWGRYDHLDRRLSKLHLSEKWTLIIYWVSLLPWGSFWRSWCSAQYLLFMAIWSYTVTGCFGWVPRRCTEPRVSGYRVCLCGCCCWQVLRWNYQRWLLTCSLGVSSNSGPILVYISCYCIFILCGRPSHFQLLSGVHHFLLLIDVLLNFGSIVGRLTHSMLLCRLLLKKFCMN